MLLLLLLSVVQGGEEVGLHGHAAHAMHQQAQVLRLPSRQPHHQEEEYGRPSDR